MSLELKFFYISDIHLETKTNSSCRKILHNICKASLPNSLNNILILGGDIGDPFSKVFLHFVETCCKYFKQVIFISGNHEYYGHEIFEVDDFLKNIKFKNFVFLNNNFIQINNVKIFGSTLWSFIPVEHESYISSNMNDFYLIKDFDVSKYNAMNREAKNSILNFTTNQNSDGSKVIIITHHCPFKKENMEIIDYAYYNDLKIDSTITKWIFGHVHKSFENGNVLTNCLGYENNFDWKLKYFEI